MGNARQDLRFRSLRSGIQLARESSIAVQDVSFNPLLAYYVSDVRLLATVVQAKTITRGKTISKVVTRTTTKFRTRTFTTTKTATPVRVTGVVYYDNPTDDPAPSVPV